MESLIMLIMKIGLLVLLWFFVLMAVRAMKRDSDNASGSLPAQGNGSVVSHGGSSIRRTPPATRLQIVEGPLQGSYLEVDQIDDIVIGRGKDCTFQVGDDYASSHHARLFKRGNDWFIEDLASRNGTYLGGYRIEQPERVAVGSDIKVGRTTVRLVP
ncbi:FHA domain-containing protein [Corynebacterium sp. 3HC-13]|uniref:FHA domain-containing protein FhaB/FipA n=1 Tax=Corynebacterium poyangense TaxID=2684405 RepID=UPI001CCB46F8|nr:FHA domain-containing protein [Corynebacterium poyangense]MBZ8177308.1 FHA domain-containing protein [Corynebacterium poyangense]